MTRRLYWEDDHCLEADAKVTAVEGSEIALDQTCFYPGGGGQPCDHGTIGEYSIAGVRVDEGGVVWHAADRAVDPGLAGKVVHLSVDPERRTAFARYHTVLHVLNTIVLRDYAGWITGAQIGVDYSRIDFNLPGFSAEMRIALEEKVNAVLQSGHSIRAYTLTEEEFRARPELLRTLEAKPPVIEGRVRVVEIESFDAQACGGTHLATTAELGRFTITKTENKGKQNKRLYVRLD